MFGDVAQDNCSVRSDDSDKYDELKLKQIFRRPVENAQCNIMKKRDKGL